MDALQAAALGQPMQLNLVGFSAANGLAVQRLASLFNIHLHTMLGEVHDTISFSKLLATCCLQ